MLCCNIQSRQRLCLRAPSCVQSASHHTYVYSGRLHFAAGGLHTQQTQMLPDTSSTPRCKRGVLLSIVVTPELKHQHAAAVHCGARPSRVSDVPTSQAGALPRMVTTMIKDSKNIHELEDVVTEWGNSFNHIHVSATFVKAARLASKKPATARPVLAQLTTLWVTSQTNSDSRAQANILWACSKLTWADPGLWSSTLSCFLQSLDTGTMQELANVAYALATAAGWKNVRHQVVSDTEVQQAMIAIMEQAYIRVTHPTLEGVSAQDVANLIWACGKLDICPQGTEVVAMLRALAKFQQLDAATSQNLSNTLYALSQLQLSGKLQVDIKPQLWEQLLAHEQCQKVANGDPQGVSNTLLALARLATCSPPLIDRDLAMNVGCQLLKGSTAVSIHKWSPQEVANSMFGCAKLGVYDLDFLARLADLSPTWIKQAQQPSVAQIAWACAMMQFKHELLTRQLLSRAKQLVQREGAHAKFSSAASTVVLTSWCVSRLDVQPLAAEIVTLLKLPAMQHQLQMVTSAPPSVLGRLWQVHTWLVDRQLLDGKGLADIVDGQVLIKGRRLSEESELSLATE